MRPNIKLKSNKPNNLNKPDKLKKPDSLKQHIKLNKFSKIRKYTRSKHIIRLSPLFVATVFMIMACFVVSDPVSAAGCDDVKFIFARGSGEKLSDTSYVAWRDSIDRTLKNSSLQYDFYELGTYAQKGYRYPAVSVSNSLGGFGNLLGAFIGRGESFDFGRSVTEGSNELQAYFKTMSAACPHMKFVLGGYSQGAMVMSRTLDQLDANRIIYVATFGDPKLYLPEGKGIIPPACRGKSYSSYRTHVPDCRAYEGVLGSYRPYQPNGYEDKLGTWCNEKDIMCSSGINVDDHVSYTSNGLYASAARKIRTKVIAAFPGAFANVAAKPWASVAHNVAILLDTTISMSNLLRQQREATENLANQVIDDGGEVAVIEFRDLDDPFSPQVLCDFGCTKDDTHEALSQIDVGGGGDYPESILNATLYAMNNLDWQDRATKSIVVFTDDEYLSPDRDGTTLDQVVKRSLEIDPVNIYVVTRKKLYSAYTELVTQTNGMLATFGDTDGWADLADTILYRPEAMLNASEFIGSIGDEFHFDASGSHASGDSELRYDWDLNGDGEFEVQSGLSIVDQVYHQSVSGYIQVKVTDATGRSSTMSAKLTVSDALSTPPEILHASATKLKTDTYRIDLETNAEQLLFSIDDSPVGYFDGTTTSFTLTDVHSLTTLHLVPYTGTLGRGEGITLQIGEASTNGSDSTKEPGPTTSSDLVSKPKPTTNPTTAIKPNSNPDMASAVVKTSIIPKAPNTGVQKTNSTASN